MTKILDDDDDILKDGETRTFKMYAKDGSPLRGFTPVQRDVAATRAAMTFDASLHRPGHRYASDTAPLNDAQRLRYGVFDAAKEKAYANRDRELTNSWRGNIGAGTSTSSDTNNDSRRDVQQTMDAAYAEYDLRIQNSWRNQS
jgi:hypothetical protein